MAEKKVLLKDKLGNNVYPITVTQKKNRNCLALTIDGGNSDQTFGPFTSPNGNSFSISIEDGFKPRITGDIDTIRFIRVHAFASYPANQHDNIHDIKTHAHIANQPVYAIQYGKILQGTTNSVSMEINSDNAEYCTAIAVPVSSGITFRPTIDYTIFPNIYTNYSFARRNFYMGDLRIKGETTVVPFGIEETANGNVQGLYMNAMSANQGNITSRHIELEIFDVDLRNSIGGEMEFVDESTPNLFNINNWRVGTNVRNTTIRGNGVQITGNRIVITKTNNVADDYIVPVTASGEHGNSLGAGPYIAVKPNTTYNLVYSSTQASQIFAFFYTTNNDSTTKYLGGYESPKEDNNYQPDTTTFAHSAVFTTPPKCNYILLRFDNEEALTGGDYNSNEFFEISLREVKKTRLSSKDLTQMGSFPFTLDNGIAIGSTSGSGSYPLKIKVTDKHNKILPSNFCNGQRIHTIDLSESGYVWMSGRFRTGMACTVCKLPPHLLYIVDGSFWDSMRLKELELPAQCTKIGYGTCWGINSMDRLIVNQPFSVLANYANNDYDVNRSFCNNTNSNSPTLAYKKTVISGPYATQWKNGLPAIGNRQFA